MAVGIGSNISALQVQRRLAQTSRSLSSAFERLSSGLRINRASDDAAGLAIAASLGVNNRVFTQGVRNLNDGISLLNVAEGAVGQLSNIVIRQRELAEQAANGTLTESQRGALDQEAQALFAEYERILNSTEYNGIDLLNGDVGTIGLQAGFGEDGELGALIREGGLETTSVLNGLGTYTNQNISFGLGIIPETGPLFLVADFNNDGIDDIAALKVSDRTGSVQTDIGIFLGQTSGNYSLNEIITEVSPYAGTLTAVGLLANVYDAGGDADFDIRYQIFIGSNLGAASIERTAVNLTSDLGSFSFNPTPAHTMFAGSDQLRSTAYGDFNDDGFKDSVNASFLVGGGVRISTQNTETLTTEAFVGESLEQAEFTLQSQGFALQALDSLEENLTLLNQIISRIGASQSRIETAASVLRVASENSAAAESQIKDVDVADESAELIRLSLLQQASAAILAQANQQPAIALSLLGALE